MSRRTGAVVTVVVLLALAAGGGLFWWNRERGLDEGSRAALAAFATAWQGKKLAGSPVEFIDGAAATAFDTAVASLGARQPRVRLTSSARDGDRANGTLRVTWPVATGVDWTYDVPVAAVHRPDGSWAVAAPARGSYLHPEVAADQTVSVQRQSGERGDLLDRDGDPLMPMGEVYPVQLDPARATAATAAALERIVDEPAGSLTAKLAKAQEAGSKAPIPVITYRRTDFLDRQVALDALKGVIYPRTEQPLALSRTFGQPLLGSFGEVTAEMVTEGEGRYAAGDRAGLSGLQGQYDAVLGGRAGVSVVSSAKKVLSESAPVDGTDVQTTLDQSVQEAAEEATAGTGSVPSALVAVDVRSGDVLASANNPALGFDRALTGQFPPGSALKVASTYAFLSKGVVRPTAKVSCPKTFVVDGYAVRNFEGESLGSPTFADDFHQSCNTAFVQLAAKLGDTDLTAAAKALGIGAGWARGLGVAGAFEGSVPRAEGKTDQAAAVIGQGRNLVSPLALAVMAGSVARGSYVPPVVVSEAEGLAPVDRSPRPLDASVVEQLRPLLRGVVTDGSATVLDGVAGGPVFGKTGTAEHGAKVPPETHAWFVGYQGDVAFAVLVEKGKSGGTVAAPVAKAFLDALAAR